MSDGKRPALPSVPVAILVAVEEIKQHKPAEMFFLFGAADVISAQHDLALDPGVWVLARWPSDRELDGAIFQINQE